jgi:hypothetical protein
MQNSYQGTDQKKYHFLFMVSAKKGDVKEGILTLDNVDHKVLFMTARPGRCRAFIFIEKYLATWARNNPLFLREPPRVAVIYSGMKENNQGRAQAIPIEISNPRGNNLHWTFDVKNLSQGQYRDIILFIDWPASLECPEPIKLEVPSLFRNQNA